MVTGSLSLTTTQRCQIQLIKDLTSFINDQADDKISAIIDLVKFDLNISTDNFVMSSGNGASTFYQVLLIKQPKSGSISYTAYSGATEVLEEILDALVTDEYNYKILRTITKPYAIIDDSVSVKRRAYFKLSGTWKVPKKLHKVGQGGVSDEHEGDTSYNQRLALVVLAFNTTVTQSTNCGYRGVYQVQFSQRNRQKSITTEF